ncbi:MAG: hypothetical protein QGH42_03200 [Kiritimatiellia bacterium]|nr:hypothetical protein [Kiritimatiellia bacterium]MDP6810938.1 hypothetical protein [Kiritimatiellia bacterium]MDP7023243.1 hypothetical protein [Kiritimatiellia bacterium]
MSTKDKETIRGLAERYAGIAQLDVQQKRIERYYKTNALEVVRPVVLINEVPWGEIKDEALVNTCSQELGGIETHLRRTLYQWEHFQADMVVPPAYRVGKRTRSTGVGVRVEETQIQSETGTSISAHEYVDLLKDEEDLAKFRIPEISYNQEATDQAMELAHEVFDGIMPVELHGHALQYNIWDTIARYRGVDSLLMDLAMRPEFMHQIAQRFTGIAEGTFRQYEELGVLDPDQIELHCTVACTDELPAKDFAGKVRRKDVWGRCAAQIFGSVSPDMHDEFDLAYNEKTFGGCGMLYYGCCEPMDLKIDILRKRFKNLRKVSITPWADPERAAEAMGQDLVMAAKPNPTNVSSRTFNPAVVEEEISGYLDACQRHGTPCEFVLKDISTIANNPDTLTQWVATVKGVVDRCYA